MKIFGNGTVWNPDRHERAFEFSKAPRGEFGVFETDDPELIALAKANGFLIEGEDPVIESEEFIPIDEPVIEVEKPRRGRPTKS